MSLRHWLRRPRIVITQIPMDPQEARVIAAHGHTEQSWAALTHQERVDARDTYTKAPRYAA